MARRISVQELQAACQRGDKITMVTAYDYTSAQFVEAAGIPLILVGDSLGMVIHGAPDTLAVDIDDVVYHTKWVARGSQRAHVIADLPFLTYTSTSQALHNAGRLMTEGGAQSIKLEGGAARADVVHELVSFGIPTMGHVGYTPQSTRHIGARIQGKSAKDATQLIADCRALQEAGAWAIVLELIPANLARVITDDLDIPTIGIGAGPDCSGQVQVWHDILGLFPDFSPRHTRVFAETGNHIMEGLREYAAAVTAGTFPEARHSTLIDEAVTQEAVRLAGTHP